MRGLQLNADCSLIIAFFPSDGRAVCRHTVTRLLGEHPLSVERIEETPKGILVFARSTQCDSLDLTALRGTLLTQALEYGYQLRLQREDLFRAMHTLAP